MQIIRTGTVLTGEYAGWTIEIQDDRAGETGGYYLFLVQNESNAFDSWFEHIEQLQQQISELDVRWN
ncbi:hypothetical protein P0D91_05810 [Pseudomonas sp. CBSPBW29]|uniref:hypothetical protein n=1 Tax=Pseudomonas sp. CBS TaxID=2971912 RepID=UPI0021ABBA67|nr:hypothetical protein [Pseudomonas sp. CBS]WEL43809.1 hypothetical protein P0D91_05810 [Pseudomonas sp. CBSPBW29]WEL64880.1 hypothetical protein P0D93_33350 [Pseudomonas sp. CBSPGW29]WEL68346.1 hypothetical protein P0D94_19255 [Pseudomonas sp. CBSPCGW29]WEL75370.1 hypothetical protein P0D92_25320 [Pseudomonas sp. CBSPAW29]WEL80390.1 hypothetical protein P0D95_20485 [Pseudomonas sp. CBSPCAW29]WEL88901.1 hypothetical protein P0D90_02745 [Pseudomonas sp. CBSPCBW29]